jgi:hypothetical protein
MQIQQSQWNARQPGSVRKLYHAWVPYTLVATRRYDALPHDRQETRLRRSDKTRLTSTPDLLHGPIGL